MKNLVLILVLTAMLPFAVLAQSTVLQSDDGEVDSTVKTKVLVIPFHQMRYYFSDCDKSVGSSSKVDVKDVRKAYLLGLDYATEASMEDHYDPINLAQMRDSIDLDALTGVYDNVSYSYQAPARVSTKKRNVVTEGFKRKSVGGNNKKATLNEMESYVTLEAQDKEYMRLNWKNPAYLEKLNTLYAPDYIVTINQFEIKTDYQRCIDRELGRYGRLIKIHYNVFRPDGKELYGDVITARYNSATDDINKIIRDNFGILSEYVTQSLPGRK